MQLGGSGQRTNDGRVAACTCARHPRGVTERKPAHETVPDFVERQITEAQARGDFDGLAGHGRPLSDLGRPDDELWWVRRKLRDEHVVDLPPALLARRARDGALAAVARAESEDEVRDVVTRTNELIRRVNRTTVSGPPTATMPLDLDRVLADWRRERPAPRPPDPPDPARSPDGGAGASAEPRPAWWWRLRRRHR